MARPARRRSDQMHEVMAGNVIARHEQHCGNAVSFPIPKRAAYAKFAHRASKYALVGVMVALTSSGVRVAVTGAGAKVFRVSAMEDALTKGFVPEALSGIAVSADDLNGDAEASAEFRAHLIGVMAKRAVAACQ